MKDNELKNAESDELAAHYDFDYSKAKPNRFAARLAQERATYVRCINNRGYEASLTLGAIYKLLPTESDPASLRVIDNEWEDYL